MRRAQLRAFHEVAEDRSVSKAAHRIGQTQPALSTQIRNLEKEYGVKLFNRTPHGLELTPEGAKLKELTQGFVTHETYIEDFLKSAGAIIGGKLNLVADDPVTAISVISPFQHSFPKVEITMSFGNTLQACQALQEQKVELAFITDLGQTDLSDSFMRLPLWRHGLSVVVPKDHALAGEEEICMPDLKGLTYINREHGSLTRQAFSDLFKKSDVTLSTVLTVGGREALREAVAQGNGIGFISDHEKGHDNRLTTIPLQDGREIFQTSIVYLQEQKERPIVQEFLGIARECIKKGEFSKLPFLANQIKAL